MPVQARTESMHRNWPNGSDLNEECLLCREMPVSWNNRMAVALWLALVMLLVSPLTAQIAEDNSVFISIRRYPRRKIPKIVAAAEANHGR